ncbi:hypothetical protein HY570_01630 [Candidatus Micrarchaeota archaeon]|nr:hypothetical protein [Candidatus Micrarchaeota archaeon]
MSYAEVPLHNPDLDYKCGPGSQWSRDTAACEQANCPFGAGRTYTLECNCGEAWDSNSSLITCSKNGLAIKCIPKGQKCEDYPDSFDVISGDCASGFEFDQENRQCIPKESPILKCTVKDLEDKPIDGAIIKYSFRTDKNDPVGSGGESITREDGAYSFIVPRSGVRKIIVSIENVNDPESYRVTNTLNVYNGKLDECSFIIYNSNQVEKRIKSEFENFLRDACFPPELVAKVKDAKIKFTKEGDSKSYYVASEKTLYISEGDLKSGWEELQRSLGHEFGHWIIDNLMDESKYYVKGIPLKGKITGGSHDTWKPTTSDSWWVDPEKTAFDEGTAEFFALLYFKSKGLRYDGDLESPDKAMRVLSENQGKGTYTEGVIASFLYQYYKNAINDPNSKPAKVFGDFYHSTKNGIGRIFGRPPRTAQEFIAARSKASGNWDCKVEDNGNLIGLGDDFGLTEAGGTKLTVEEGKVDSDPEKVGVSSSALKAGQQIIVPPSSGLISIKSVDRNSLENGKVPIVYLGDGENDVQIAEDGKTVILNKGKAYVIDGKIRTPNIEINDLGTEYVVEYNPDAGLNIFEESITVIDGEIEVVFESMGGQRVLVKAGEAVDVKEINGISQPRKADLAKVSEPWTSYSTKGKTGVGPDIIPPIPCLPALGGILILSLFVALRKRL